MGFRIGWVNGALVPALAKNPARISFTVFPCELRPTWQLVSQTPRRLRLALSLLWALLFHTLPMNPASDSDQSDPSAQRVGLGTGVGLENRGAQFPQTDWSRILSSQPDDRREMLAQLCQNYWYPLYAYLRRKGHSSPDAQDHTQGFLANMIAKDYLSRADQDRGRFRSFLLTSLTHYVADVRKRETAEKRGGGRVPVSIDEELAEQRYQNEPSDEVTPEKLYDRNWALTVMKEVMKRLEHDYVVSQKQALFEVMSDFIQWNARNRSYKEAAEELGLTENALKIRVVRFRKRYRQYLEEYIEQIVSDPEQVPSEIDHLISSFE